MYTQTCVEECPTLYFPNIMFGKLLKIDPGFRYLDHQ